MRNISFTLFLAFVLSFYKSHSINYFVNQTVGANDVFTSTAGSNLNPGSSSLPFATLSKALSVAVSGDSIFVDADTYNSVNDVNLVISALQNNIHIVGAGVGQTIFDGVAGNAAFNFITISANNVSISDLSVQNYDNGGAVEINASSLTDSTRVFFHNVYFFNNRTYISFFTNPMGPEGGAIWIGVNGASLPAVVHLNDCQFSSNFAQDGLGGGAIFVSGKSNLIMSGCRFTCNNDQSPNLTTFDGGAIYFDNSFGTIFSSYFSGNEVNNQQGGAIYALNTLGTYLPIQISRSIFTANHGRQGTAVFIEGNYNCTMLNSLFYLNETTGGFGDGGTISSKGSPNMNITNCTVANNVVLSGTDGSGLANEGANSYNVYNSIIWGNQVGNVSATFPVNATYCLIQPVGDAHSGVLGNLNVNPLFTSASDFTLQATSPAINSGNLTSAPLVDLTGFARVANPDMGAFELGSAFPQTSGICSYWIPCQFPVITSSNPVASICSGSVFSTSLSTNTAANQTTYTWTSSLVSGVTGHSNSGTGNISETLLNTTSSPLVLSYSINPTYNGTCAGTQVTYSVTINPIPSITALFPDTICSNETLSVPLQASVNSNFTWVASNNLNTTGESLTNQSGSTINDLLVNSTVNPQIVTYNVTPSSVSGNCTGQSQSVNVVVNPLPPNPVITPASLSACSGDSILLTSSNTIGNIWSTGDTTSFIYVNNSGIVSLVSENSYQCLSSSTSVNVNFNPLPSSPALTLSNSNPLCAGDSVQIISSIPSGIIWNTNQTTQNIVVSNSGNYSASYTDANGCTSDTATIQVLFNSNPPVPLVLSAGPLNFCNGDSVQLSSNVSVGNLWNTGDTTASITVTTSGNYSVTVTDNNGCSSSSAALAVNVFSNPPVPLVSLSGPSTFCNGDSVVLTSSSLFGNVWNTGDTTQSITVTSSGNFSVSVGAFGCSSSSANLSINELNQSAAPLIAVTDTGLCPGEDAVLNSNMPFGNLWSTGDTTSTITVALAGNYSLTYSDLNGCISDTAQVSIQVYNQPPAPLIVSNLPTTFCAGDSVVLNVSPGTGIVWNPSGSTDSSLVVYSSGTFSVTYTDNNGCSSLSQPVQTFVNSLPSSPLVLASGPVTFCDGDSVVLMAQPGTGINWLPNNSTDSMLVVTQSGSYSVEYTDTNGCTSISQSLSITVNANPATPILSLNQSDSSICTGQQVQISASPSTGITWIPGGSTAGFILVSDSGNYSAIYTDANGCKSDTANLEIAVNSNPLISSIFDLDTASCGLNIGGVHNLQISSGTPAYSFQWISNTNVISTDSILENVSAGTYELIVTDSEGCSDTLSAINVPSTNGLQISAVSDVYQGLEGLSPTVNSITLNGNPISYSWSLNGSVLAGVTDSLIQLQNLSQGVYAVQVVALNSQGCSDTAQVLIIIDANVDVSIPNVFSPNGDQTNDLFSIQVKGVKEFSLSIYDRWGILLWKGYGVNAGWDGKAPNGEKVPEGTYYYIFSGLGLNDKKVEKHGFILLAD